VAVVGRERLLLGCLHVDGRGVDHLIARGYDGSGGGCYIALLQLLLLPLLVI
jgi:hypothetical protein